MRPPRTAVRLERTCKPGSVPAPREGRRAGDHFSRTTVARGLERPTRKWDGTGRPVPFVAERTPSCLALLRVGFAEPDRSPGLLVSSYLTVSPLPPGSPPEAVCFLLHFPWPRGRWALPTTLTLRSPDFPPAASPRPAAARSAPVTAPLVYAPRPSRARAGRCDRPLAGCLTVPTAGFTVKDVPLARGLRRAKPLRRPLTPETFRSVFRPATGRDQDSDRCTVNFFQSAAVTRSRF